MSPAAVVLVLISIGLHAGWNLLAHARNSDTTLFLRTNLVTGLVGLGPVLVAELWGTPFPASVWALLAVTGCFQTLYFLGLTMGYRHGDFSVVYPVARALPILFLALVDMGRGRVPSALAWIGIGLVIAGCGVLPLVSLREIRPARYLNRTGFWILVTALGGTGYSTIDKLAAEMMPSTGAGMAARYGVLESLFTAVYLWLIFRFVIKPPQDKPARSQWRQGALVALVIFAAYWLVLWAYQLSPYVSYVVALRQLSIALGVGVAVWLFREPAPYLRIAAALTITAGTICVAIAP